MKLLGVSGSLTPRSKTLLAIEKVLEFAAQSDPNTQTQLLNLRDYRVEFCDGRDPSEYTGDTRLVIDQIVHADALIIGTPVYRGSYTGALKNLFDLIPNEALNGKVVGFVATGGTYHHYLVLEHLLTPLAGYFRAIVAPGSVYVHNGHYSDKKLVDPEIIHRLKRLSDNIVFLSHAIRNKNISADELLIPRESLKK